MFTLASVLALTALGGVAVPAAAAWRSEQPVSAELGVPVPLGPIGDIEFWAPNRGLLITGGTDAVRPGLFAYDGTGWYRLSTVCGGAEGRIAWAGPNEWWTISDQRVGQQQGQAPVPPQQRSLCHFRDGQVVASYAEPLGSATGYLPMNAAACSGPGDCWFAGRRLSGTPNQGAFHLHWDGTRLRQVPSLTVAQPEIAGFGRTVADLAYHGGRLFESVQVQEDDVAPNESSESPYRLHEIMAGSDSPFLPLLTSAPIAYGQPQARPWQLDAFRFASGGGVLWAIAGATESPAAETALQLGPTGFAQVPLLDGEGALDGTNSITGVAAEPDAGAAWLAYSRSSEGNGTNELARVARVGVDGTIAEPTLLPGSADGIGRKGRADEIACPGSGQCWVATSRGWLFHLGDAPSRNTDPLFHRLIDFRPPDNGVPFLPPDSLPVDDSGAVLPPDFGDPGGVIDPGELSPRPRRRALVYDVRQRMVGATTLRISFKLRARARVQLVAKRRRRVVARTARRTLAPGRRSLRLRLDRRRWPTKLDLRANEVKRRDGARASVTIRVARARR